MNNELKINCVCVLVNSSGNGIYYVCVKEGVVGKNLIEKKNKKIK